LRRCTTASKSRRYLPSSTPPCCTDHHVNEDTTNPPTAPAAAPTRLGIRPVRGVVPADGQNSLNLSPITALIFPVSYWQLVSLFLLVSTTNSPRSIRRQQPRCDEFSTRLLLTTSTIRD
jgi:hypothetical protein